MSNPMQGRRMAACPEEPNGWKPGTYGTEAYPVLVGESGRFLLQNGLPTALTVWIPFKRRIHLCAEDTLRIVIRRVSGTNRHNFFDGLLYNPNTLQFASNQVWSNNAVIFDGSMIAGKAGDFAKFGFKFRAYVLETALTIKVEIYLNGVKIV